MAESRPQPHGPPPAEPTVSAPRHLPWRAWKDVFVKVGKEYSNDNISLIGAGLSFYALLSIFPALIAVVSIYGLAADPADVQRQVQSVADALPASARTLMMRQLAAIVTSSSAGLGWGVALSFAGFLWSTASGANSLINAINIAYDTRSTRGFVKQTLLSFLFAICFIVAVIVAVAAITVLPQLFDWLGFGSVGSTLVAWLRWPALVAIVLLVLAVLYQFAPDRKRPKWRWVTWGSVVATLVWTGASLLFSWYAASFAKFNQTYGTLGGVIVLLMWFYLSGIAVLIGAELNAELERHRKRGNEQSRPQPQAPRYRPPERLGHAPG